jgi:hypothetical protein
MVIVSPRDAPDVLFCMKFMRQMLALAFLVAALLSELAGQTRWSGDGGISPRVGIFLDFDQSPSQSSLEAMQREVAALFSETGATFSWHILNAGTASHTFDELAILRFRGNCRAGKFTGSAFNPGRITLGSTEMSSEGVTGYSRVECGQLKDWLAETLATFRPGDRDEVFGRALGRVVSHELYHVLGRTAHHTDRGVAKALQSPFDLVKENFHLDRQAVSWLRQRLQPPKKDRARDAAPERDNPAVLASLEY